VRCVAYGVCAYEFGLLTELPLCRGRQRTSRRDDHRQNAKNPVPEFHNLWPPRNLTAIFWRNRFNLSKLYPLPRVESNLSLTCILERTARGRADAKANGVKFGRKPILTPHQQKEARKRLEAGETQRSVARSYNVIQSTVSRLTA
jgi:hypothetical protein